MSLRLSGLRQSSMGKSISELHHVFVGGMRMKKGRWLIGLGIVLLLVAALFLGLREDREAAICGFVKAHSIELEKIAQDCLRGVQAPGDFWGVVVEGVFPGEEPIVQFRYAATGLVPSTTYYGFYYAQDDAPACYQNVALALAPQSDGTWTWSDGIGNGGVTRRIAPHWFYYEAWF